MSDEQAMTLAELAAWLKVKPAVIYGLRYRGDGPPGFKVGRELRFRSVDVDRWTEQRRES